MRSRRGLQKTNRYSRIIENIFHRHYKKGADKVHFARDEIIEAAKRLKITLPKNIGDLVYTFRYRGDLPESIKKKCPPGKAWIILPKGIAKYCFVASPITKIAPNANLAITKIPDATPGMISRYALTDEQALLAKLRYNRMVDIFTGVTCYSLQSHLRTTVPNIGQIETDELYVGVDRRGVHYVFPIQAKSSKDTLSIVQIAQDFELCATRFSKLICFPIGAQFLADNLIALFAFEKSGLDIKVLREKHYQLVPQEKISISELEKYQERPLEQD